MKIIDANEEGLSSYNADIAIIGAGIAGVFFAFLLRNSKYKIIIIDRGNNNFNYSKEIRTVNKGIYHKASQSSKGLMLGGNGALWGGQLSEFQEGDIKKSFWGMNYNKLKNLYIEVYKILKIKPNNSILKDKKYKINFYFTYFLREPNLFKIFKKRLIDSKNVLIVSNLIAQELIFKDSLVKSLKCKNYKNNQVTLNAKSFFFCMGTIESIRFFLINKLVSGNNPLKKLSRIGHFFQDHISIYCGKLFIKSKKLFIKQFENRLVGNIVHQPKICNDIDNKKKLSMCMDFGSESHENKLAENSKKNLKKFKNHLNIRNFFNLFKLSILKYTILYILHYVAFKRIKSFFNKNASVNVNIVSEQLPLVESKLVLNNKKLKDGLNQIILHWKISGTEFKEIKNFLNRAIFFFKDSGIGILRTSKTFKNYRNFIRKIEDTNHASGGLIISTSPKNGVCDKNFRVWGTSNLHVLSSALFPNSSHSNITLTLMALTLKMSKKLLSKKYF